MEQTFTIEDIIKLPFNDEIVDKTVDNVIKKYLTTKIDLMYGRSPVELLDNLIMGDIAKNSMIYYIKNNVGLDIIDYDEIRTDNFKDADPGWDFKIGKDKYKVEVKSSIPPNNEDYGSIIKSRDIKITAGHDEITIQPEDIDCDIHIQVYFYCKKYRKGYDSFEELGNVIKKNPEIVKKIVNITKYNPPLFFGWNSKEMIIKFSKILKPNTWSFSWTRRIYWRCPIKYSYPIKKLITYVKEQEAK